jgi:hypothetical protein
LIVLDRAVTHRAGLIVSWIAQRQSAASGQIVPRIAQRWPAVPEQIMSWIAWPAYRAWADAVAIGLIVLCRAAGSCLRFFLLNRPRREARCQAGLITWQACLVGSHWIA